MNTINKDTKIYGSFSNSPGNNGCIFFNKKFKENNINAVYKSFYSDNIQKSIEAAKTLNFGGFAVSMPFKEEVLKYIDEMDDVTKIIGAANTITNNNGTLKAYNTDFMAIHIFFKDNIPKELTILGNGGFSKAIQYACKCLGISYNVIIRNDFAKVPNLEGLIFNATPIDVSVKGHLIDGRPFTSDGKKIALIQAEEQYKLYTNCMI